MSQVCVLTPHEEQAVKAALHEAKACLYCPSTASEAFKEGAITKIKNAQEIFSKKERKRREKTTKNS
ncbi:hypothetical protein P886_3813 [Alteromonadaceae bacterium 2753L.S.0a.02]|nr:hypothetical protein P886_3813 [Alteromonadaceae bacterium 2753L.S.0a.02]